jgi:hypothetical protein
MKKSIILALFNLFLISCNKETVDFHVKIINPATGEGYANHKFYIKSSRTGMNVSKFISAKIPPIITTFSA